LEGLLPADGHTVSRVLPLQQYLRAIDIINKRHFSSGVFRSFSERNSTEPKRRSQCPRMQQPPRRSPRRNQSMDQAGIGATACSVLILVIVLLAMHTRCRSPSDNGPDAPAGRPVGWRTGRATPEAGMTVGKQEMKVAATRCDEGMRRDNGQLKSRSLFGLGCGVTIVVAR